VVHSEERAETGMHYTSVSNIMKVIEPLFLSQLRDIFEENFNSVKGLEKLRLRLRSIKVFDPACGSGNFLIIAFKELRKLEMEIYQRLRELDMHYQSFFTLPEIKLTQFYGIEVDDFAHEVAMLSLWLAEHQMNVKFKENLGVMVPALPLKPGGNIVCGNATTMDWRSVCPVEDEAEIYVLGNPPYVGFSYQTVQQKEDIAEVFDSLTSAKKLDYISCWFAKGAEYIGDSDAQVAFVTTNSICQGEQVASLWPLIFNYGLEIRFAHKSFKWGNSAKHNAGVTCSIVGLARNSDCQKKLFVDDRVREVKNINAYLSASRNVIVEKFAKTISSLPPMLLGSSPVDDGNLILSFSDYQKLVSDYPQSERFIRPLMGSNEFINGNRRWCIWVDQEAQEEAYAIKPLRERFERVKRFRSASKKGATRELAKCAYRFGEPRRGEGSSIIVPQVSSERRQYLPMGFLSDDSIITNLAFGIYTPEPWVFAVVSSRMHSAWVRAVSGKLEERIRYSVQLCYNTFPLPELLTRQKEALETHVFNILQERELHSEKTIAQLYDPDTMPLGLFQAHLDLDAAVERCFRSKPFKSDEDRLDFLLYLYEEMAENVEETDFEGEQDLEDA
jgi:hypothetical protein